MKHPQNNIFETGRHKELNEEKFKQICKDIEDFATLAKHSDVAYYRLYNIMLCAKVELALLKKKE